jgi:hypothetical protein
MRPKLLLKRREVLLNIVSAVIRGNLFKGPTIDFRLNPQEQFCFGGRGDPEQRVRDSDLHGVSFKPASASAAR